MQTYMANPDKIERKWYVVDADGCTLGRLASGVASVLRGKNKPQFTPHVDTGDYVIIVNADKIKVTGKKLEQKIYYNHSDYVGGMRETSMGTHISSVFRKRHRRRNRQRRRKRVWISTGRKPTWRPSGSNW